MFSKITLIGSLGGDPEVKLLPSGRRVMTFRLAVNEQWRSNGERHQHTSWFRVSMYQNGDTGLVSAMQPLLKKGKTVFIDGSPRVSQAVVDGARREYFDVVIGAGDKIRLLSSRDHGEVNDDQDVPEAVAA